MKNCKKYGLKAARKPKIHPLLSGVAVVGSMAGKGVAFYTFTEAFVEAVGKAMPQGISRTKPAHLKLLYIPGRGWDVFAVYLNELRGVLLWTEPEYPKWLGPYIVPD